MMICDIGESELNKWLSGNYKLQHCIKLNLIKLDFFVFTCSFLVFCPSQMFIQCKKKHMLICLDFSDNGTCPRGNSCPMQHPKKQQKSDVTTKVTTKPQCNLASADKTNSITSVNALWVHFKLLHIYGCVYSFCHKLASICWMNTISKLLNG